MEEGGAAGWQARAQELEGQLASVRAEVRVHPYPGPAQLHNSQSGLNPWFLLQADAARITTDNLVEVSSCLRAQRHCGTV